MVLSPSDILLPNQPPSVARYIAQRLLLWMPRKMWQVRLVCPHLECEDHYLTSAGIYTRIRQVLDIDGYYIWLQNTWSVPSAQGSTQKIIWTGCRGSWKHDNPFHTLASNGMLSIPLASACHTTTVTPFQKPGWFLAVYIRMSLEGWTRKDQRSRGFLIRSTSRKLDYTKLLEKCTRYRWLVLHGHRST